MARTRLAREAVRPGGRERRKPALFCANSSARSVRAARCREVSLINSGSIRPTDSPRSWTDLMSAFKSAFFLGISHYIPVGFIELNCVIGSLDVRSHVRLKLRLSDPSVKESGAVGRAHSRGSTNANITWSYASYLRIRTS